MKICHPYLFLAGNDGDDKIYNCYKYKNASFLTTE